MNQQDIKNKLLDFLAKAEKPLQLNEISKLFGLRSDTDDYFLLKEVIADLTEQSIIQKSSRRRFSIKTFDAVSTCKGIISITEDRGVVPCTLSIPVPTPKGSEPQYLKRKIKVVIKRRNLHTALDGDTVLVKLLAEKKGKKPRGEVLEVISRNDRLITGTIEYDGNFYFLIPTDEKHYVDFLIPQHKLNGAKGGDKVSVRLLGWDDPLKSPTAEVAEILGRSDKPGVGFKAVMSEFSLPYDFNPSVMNEAEELSASFSVPDILKHGKRLDLRKDIIITIDPADAKDFDDALSLTHLENGNKLLGVHIADVSHFVKQGGETDKEAYKRGTSVYLVDRVVPMLPEEISNILCSLQPDVERLAFSVFMEINHLGTVKSYKIAESVIRSKKRLNYNEVLKKIEGFKNGKQPKTKVDNLIKDLNELSELLRKKRLEKGGIDFETVEIKFELDDENNPVKAIQRQTTPATSLVEECMLMANKTVAGFVYDVTKSFRLKQTLPFLYRVHDLPDAEKMRTTMRFLKVLTGEKVPGTYDSKSLNAFLKEFADKTEKPIVHQMIVRSMPKAEYTNENIGHFGLGFARYTHFTSPIRRYPDLVVHRLVKEYLQKTEIHFDKNKRLDESLARIGYHSTERERVAMEAERASVKFALTYLASNLVGQKFNGTISGVTNFGIFVTLDDIYAEGLLHIRDLDDDYYMFDEDNYRLIGKTGKKVYRFGDRIEVLLVKADLERRKIELRQLPKPQPASFSRKKKNKWHK